MKYGDHGKEMETRGVTGIILGLYRDYRVYIGYIYWDNGNKCNQYSESGVCADFIARKPHHSQ